MLLSPCDSFESGMEDEILREIEGNRPRSRTWPLPQPEDFESQKSPEVEEKISTAKLEPGSKKGSRKNAWGNQSYADLITQAIQSAPEQRMTLSQIYAWMVENVVYFKDKGDNTSSAGWKVCKAVFKFIFSITFKRLYLHANLCYYTITPIF
jgi:hypothetical protein